MVKGVEGNSIIDLVRMFDGVSDDGEMVGLSSIICDGFKYVQYGRIRTRVLMVTRKIRYGGRDGEIIPDTLTVEDFGNKYYITFKRTGLINRRLNSGFDTGRKFGLYVMNDIVNYLGSEYCPIMDFKNIGRKMNDDVEKIIREANMRISDNDYELEIRRMEREMDRDYDQDDIMDYDL